MTKYAQQILDIINASSDHLTAEKIYLRLKASNAKVVLATVYNNLNLLYEQASNSKVVLATVYNNLNLLYEQDLIRKVTVEGYPDRYDKIIKHDHLVCKKCGALSDICLSDLTAQLQAQIPEEIISYDLKINYICPSCQEDNPWLSINARSAAPSLTKRKKDESWRS